MQPGTAEIHVLRPDWNGWLPYLILRAAHYLEEYHGVLHLYLNCSEVPENVRNLWDCSLQLRQKKIAIHCDPARNIECSVFQSPDFMMKTADGVIPLGGDSTFDGFSSSYPDCLLLGKHEYGSGIGAGAAFRSCTCQFRRALRAALLSGSDLLEQPLSLVQTSAFR